MSPRFGELRSLLHGPPGRLAWERLCRLLDEAPAWERDERLLPYALDHLARWPDHERVLPQRWLEGALTHPRAYADRQALTRWLVVRGPRLTLDAARALRQAKLSEHLSGLLLENLSCEAMAMAELLGQDDWPALTHLSLARTSLSGPDLDALLRLPALGRLRHLNLHLVNLRDAGLERLASGQALQALRELNLSGNRLSDAALASMLMAQSLPSLQALDLSKNPVGPLVFEQLWRPGGPGPTALALGGHELDAQALGALLASVAQRQGALGALTLSHARVTSDQLRALLRAAHGLQALTLRMVEPARHDELGPAPLALTTLRLTWTPQDARSLKALCGPTWASLQTLDLTGCSLTEADLLRWTQTPMRAQLRALTLASTKLTDVGLGLLLRSEHLRHVAHLDLCNNPLSDDVIAELAALPALGQLRELRVSGTQITARGLERLARSPHLSDALKASLR